MSEREKILTRVRDALRVPAPRPGQHGGASLDQGEDASRHDVPDYSDWLPLVGADFESRAALFARNAADLKAEFFLLESGAELPARFDQLARENKWKRVATHRAALTDLALRGTTLDVLKVDDGYRVDDMEAADAA